MATSRRAAARASRLPTSEFESLLSAILGRLRARAGATARATIPAWRSGGTCSIRSPASRCECDLAGAIVAGLGAGIDDRGGLRLADRGETITLYGGQVLRDREPSAAAI